MDAELGLQHLDLDSRVIPGRCRGRDALCGLNARLDLPYQLNGVLDAFALWTLPLELNGEVAVVARVLDDAQATSEVKVGKLTV